MVDLFLLFLRQSLGLAHAQCLGRGFQLVGQLGMNLRHLGAVPFKKSCFSLCKQQLRLPSPAGLFSMQRAPNTGPPGTGIRKARRVDAIKFWRLIDRN